MRSAAVVLTIGAFVAAVGLSILLPVPASAQSTAAKKVYTPDCSKFENALAKAQEAQAAIKLDLSACKPMPSAERSKCERGLRTAYNQAINPARAAVREAQKALSCCKRPSGSGCGGAPTYIR